MATEIKFPEYANSEVFKKYFDEGTDIVKEHALAQSAVFIPDKVFGPAVDAKYKKEQTGKLVKGYNTALNAILDVFGVTKDGTKELYEFFMKGVGLKEDDKEPKLNPYIMQVVGMYLLQIMKKVTETAPADALIAKGKQAMEGYFKGLEGTLDDLVNPKKKPQGE